MVRWSFSKILVVRCWFATSLVVPPFSNYEPCLLDREQVLKKLPGLNQDPGVDATTMVLNDSMLDLLNEKLGLAPNAPQKKKKHGPKVPAGKRITELPEKQNIAPKENEPGTSNDCRKRKAAKSNQLVKDTVSEESWECGLCVHAWDMQGDDVWIQCARCDAPLHFPCCGL